MLRQHIPYRAQLLTDGVRPLGAITQQDNQAFEAGVVSGRILLSFLGVSFDEKSDQLKEGRMHKMSDKMTCDALLAFANNDLLPKLKDLSGSGDIVTLIKAAFDGANNYMKNGTLMRQVINKINGIDFNVSDDRHLFGDIYEKLLKDLQSAGTRLISRDKRLCH